MLLMNELCRCSKRHKSRRDAVGNAPDNDFHVVTSPSAHLQGSEGGESGKGRPRWNFNWCGGEKRWLSKANFSSRLSGVAWERWFVLQLLAEPREMSEEQTVGLIRFLFRSAALPAVHFSLVGRPRAAFIQFVQFCLCHDFLGHRASI